MTGLSCCVTAPNACCPKMVKWPLICPMSTPTTSIASHKILPQLRLLPSTRPSPSRPGRQDGDRRVGAEARVPLHTHSLAAAREARSLACKPTHRRHAHDCHRDQPSSCAACKGAHGTVAESAGRASQELLAPSAEPLGGEARHAHTRDREPASIGSASPRDAPILFAGARGQPRGGVRWQHRPHGAAQQGHAAEPGHRHHWRKRGC